MFTAERTTSIVIVMLMASLTLMGVLSGYPRQAILFPIVTTACGILFTAMRFLEFGRAQAAAAHDPQAKQKLKASGERLEVRAALVPFAWVLGVLIFLYLFGYQVGLTAYVFTFLIAHSTGLKLALGISAGTAALIYLIFTVVLQSLLPVGLVGDALGF